MGSLGGLQAVLEATLGSSRYILPGLALEIKDISLIPVGSAVYSSSLQLCSALCLLSLADFWGISRVGANTAAFATPVSCPLNSKAGAALPSCCKGEMGWHRLSVFRCNFQTPEGKRNTRRGLAQATRVNRCQVYISS